MKRILTALALTVALAVSLCPAAHAQELQPAGTVYATDITVLLDGHPIPAYNVDGRMALLLEDMLPYGFVLEEGEEGPTLRAAERPETYPDYTPVSQGPSGQVIGTAYYAGTPIWTGEDVYWREPLLINGKLGMWISDLGTENTNTRWHINPNSYYGYGNYGYRVTWDPEARVSTLDALHPGDTLEVDGASYTVTGLYRERWSAANAVSYWCRDGVEQMVNGAVRSSSNSYFDVELYADILSDYGWTFENGEIHLTLPEVVPDTFYVGHLTDEEKALYPNRRGLVSSLFISHYGVTNPLVAIPVYVHQGGETRTFFADAMVFLGKIKGIHINFFQQAGLPVIHNATLPAIETVE